MGSQGNKDESFLELCFATARNGQDNIKQLKTTNSYPNNEATPITTIRSGSSTCIAMRHASESDCTDENDNDDKDSDSDGHGDSMYNANMMTVLVTATPAME